MRTERLERIAQATGGRYFFTPSPGDLRGFYESIGKEIKGEYVLTYRAPDSGEFVRTLTAAFSPAGAGAVVSSRPYFQPASSLFGPSAVRGAGILWPGVLVLLSAGLLGTAGLRRVERTKLCPACGTEAGAQAKFCPHCGGKFSRAVG